MVNLCLAKLLLNEVYDTPNRKLIKINERIINLLIENLSSMLCILPDYDIKPNIMFDAIFCLIGRSLYYNVPLALNYLLIVTLPLKRIHLGP